MCSLLEVHTLGPTSTKYMPWAMRFTCQAVAVTGVLAYDVGGRCAHFQRGTAKTGSFGAKIKIHRKLGSLFMVCFRAENSRVYERRSITSTIIEHYCPVPLQCANGLEHI
jgi:hypothetical protein